MNADKFTTLVKEHCRDFAVEWMEGENVGVSTEAQNWLDSLSASQKMFLREVLQETIDLSLINVLEIMDGVHELNSVPFESTCGTDKISGEECSPIHDLYASKVDVDVIGKES